MYNLNRQFCNKSLIFTGATPEKEILLEPEASVLTQLEELRSILSPSSPNVLTRGNSFEFVHLYTHSEFYFSKCFPNIFPFGRGCPSDKMTKLSNLRSHSQKMLKRGGGPEPRRFQQSPNYYFTVYNALVKQKIGGIAMLA